MPTVPRVAQVHRSPGFITSNLIGKRDDGTMIKEYEASHGTVADMWEAHQRGEETSMNPLGMVEALIGAMNHSADLAGGDYDSIHKFTAELRSAMHTLMVSGKGTRDLCGPSGLTTEQFVDLVAETLASRVMPIVEGPITPFEETLDEEALRALFAELDTDKNGEIDFEELKLGLKRMGVSPRKLMKGDFDEEAAERDILRKA